MRAFLLSWSGIFMAWSFVLAIRGVTDKAVYLILLALWFEQVAFKGDA